MSRSLRWSALVVVLGLELSLGTVTIPLKNVLSILCGGHDGGEAWRNIILLFGYRARLPQCSQARRSACPA